MTQAAEPELIYRLPASLAEDLENLRAMISKFKAGEIPAAQFRAFRVPQGVYEQREEGAFMLRVRCPAGGVLPHQMKALANVARKYGKDVLHVTTRQDIQVHRVPLDKIHPALVELRSAGLSTKGGGGNTVRNITVCYDAGVCAKETFDVSPYAIALTEFLLPDPLSFRLPRKYKIAFSGCPEDCAAATVNDLGFVAGRRNGQLGFAVYVGGGMGAYSRVADPFDEFVPAGEIHLVAEAVKRVFDKHGNRKNKHKARLRFLIEQIGCKRFRELYETELAELRKSALPELAIRDIPTRTRQSPPSATGREDGFEEWRSKNIVPQKQDGFNLIHIPLFLGDIPADTLGRLADVVQDHGEGMVRTTQWQNLVIRSVHENELPVLYGKLKELDLAKAFAPLLRNTVACAGAATCKLGICLSRGLARGIVDRLTDGELNLEELGKLNVQISGCPNSCGRHPVAHIGLYGAARRVGGRLVPHYVFQVGGRVGEGRTRLAEGKEAVPAWKVPALIADFLRAFRESSEFPDYDAFLDAQGRETARRLTATHKYVPSFEEDKNYYFDWGATTQFSLAGRGPGECGAGVFDLIEVDLASAGDALKDGNLYAATVLAARALLVTQGQEAKDDRDALLLFSKHFVEVGLVSKIYQALIQKALAGAGSFEAEKDSGAERDEVGAFVSAVQKLYDNVDPSLRFRPVTEAAESKAEAAVPQAAEEAEFKIDREANFRGVACPLNYVKTKLLLEQMASGEVLSVVLDDEGARNVPQSTKQDGHDVLSVTRDGKSWRVIIRKSQA